MTSTSPPRGNVDVITLDHMQRMKDQAIVANIGHFDNEIQVDPSAHEGREENQHQTAGGQVHLPRWSRNFPASRRPLGKSRLRHRPPELRHVQLIFQPGPRAARSLEEQDTYKVGVYVLPKKLDEEVARLHLEKIGVKLTKLSQKQADYLGIPIDGPFKSEHYRY